MGKYRNTLIKIHVVVAAFFLPVGLMFAITGGLYTIGIKGAVESTKHDIALTEPLAGEMGALVAVAEKELARLDLSSPSGSASVRNPGPGGELEWTGVNRDISLRRTSDPLVAQLEVKNASFHRRFVQLHKAKGSALAKTISVAWGIGLIVLLGTGMVIACAVPTHRKLTLGTSIAGLVTFFLYAFIG